MYQLEIDDTIGSIAEIEVRVNEPDRVAQNKPNRSTRPTTAQRRGESPQHMTAGRLV
jgi:hypothetical protein